MNIYLKTGKNGGLSRSLNLLDVGNSFIVFLNEDSKATHIQAALSKINKSRKAKGLEVFKIRQKKILMIDPKTCDSEICYLVERVE